MGKCPNEDDIAKFKCKDGVVEWIPLKCDLDWYSMYCTERLKH